MMGFDDFARSHGLIVRSLIPHRWIATPTEDHPRKRNGRYKFLGDIGWVQNWATMQTPVMWTSNSKVDYRPMFREANRQRMDEARAATKKAGWILHQCKKLTHPYLESKGFPEEVADVWETDGKKLLVLPMRKGGFLIGCQLIDEQGQKKFLQGQTTKGATLSLDAKGMAIFCEGYATGLSIRAVMRAIKMRYTIYICFSAGNMKEVARDIAGGIVVADNDASETGLKAAQETGKPYWLAPTVGDDFNDAHQAMGLFQISQSLKRVLIHAKS
jgi:putative DNA primase/helicase